MDKSNIKTIAERLNLSPGTVSIVLNGRGDEMRIAKKTQKRILEESRLLGYQPNIYARRLRQKATGNSTTVIGVLWPSLWASELLVRFFDGIRQTILEDGADIEVVYKPYHYSEIQKVGEVFKTNPFNGLIVVGASDSDVEYVKTETCSMPIVFFCRQNEKYSSVGIDDYSTGNKVAELFYARGHKNVALVESDLLVRQRSLRSAGFVDGCQRYGINLSPSNRIKESSTDDGGFHAAHKLLKSDNFPTAVFCSLGTMSYNAYPVLKEKGIKIPEDIEIMSFGDSATSQLLRPSLSVIDLPVQEIVKKCVHLIVDLISGRIRQNATIYEETYFIFRESCGGFPKEK